MITDLTLAQTIQTVCQSEEVATQVSMQGETVSMVRAVVSTSKQPVREQLKPKDKIRADSHGKCGHCRNAVHASDERCPAKKGKCHKIGHWARVCHSNRSVREVTECFDQPSYFLGSVYNLIELEEQWMVQLLIGANPVKFKIDKGAEVNIVAEETFSKLVLAKALEPANVTLDSPGGKLACLGQFRATAVYKGQSYPFSSYVVHKYNVNNLLSRTLSADMNLVRGVEEANRVASKHYDAFVEHSTLKTDPVKIQLKDSELPRAVHTVRHVPIPMLQKVKEE